MHHIIYFTNFFLLLQNTEVGERVLEFVPRQNLPDRKQPVSRNLRQAGCARVLTSHSLKCVFRTGRNPMETIMSDGFFFRNYVTL